MRACGAVAAATVAAMTLPVCHAGIGRNLGLPSPDWVNEVTEYAMRIATLAAAPWLMWRNQHVRPDLLGALPAPAGFAFLAIDPVGAVVYLGGEGGLMQVVRNGVASVTSCSLTPIPFFVRVGEVLFHTGLPALGSCV